MEKYPGLIPTFHPMENGKFKNLELLHTGGLGEQLIFYQHSLNASLYIASAYQIMLKAKDYNALFISFPHNKKLASGGVLHQGELSFKHGLPGLSYLSEEVVIARDIELARASGARLHFHQISSKRSVELSGWQKMMESMSPVELAQATFSTQITLLMGLIIISNLILL